MSDFTEADHNSGDGMITTVWGPMAWNFLHLISFNYPIKPTAQDKQQYTDFLLSLGKILPCRYCRDNFSKNLKSCNFSPNVFKDRETFSKFIYRLHNHVNETLGKTNKLTYLQVRNRYEHFRTRCIQDAPQQKNKEKSCTSPLYGKKSKCVIHIVPTESNCESFKMDSRCVLKKLALGTVLDTRQLSTSKKRSSKRSTSKKRSSKK